MKLLLKNGRVIDPGQNSDGVRDILVEDGRISGLAGNIKPNGAKVIDCSGKIILPGLVDMHVHLREPGREDKETVASATAAAAAGGVTTVLAMPNTYPALDRVEVVQALQNIIAKTAKVNVLTCGAITISRLGKELSDIAALKKNGVIAISDDGSSVDDAKLMAQAFVKAQKEKVLVICHCQDKSLSPEAVVNLGFTSTRMGLRGISNASEFKRVERDIELARIAGARVHIAHVSCRESIELIAAAKKEGVAVTAETAPHYFSLSEDDVLEYDTNKKINPPLRSKEDVVAIAQALKNGTIDAIASDHAPHTENDKDIEFDRAEFGTIGLETSLAVTITELVATGVLDWLALARVMAANPSRILGINKGTLDEGSHADIVVIDPDKEWVVEKAGIISKSKNSAFLGRRLKGVVEYTLCRGEGRL